MPCPGGSTVASSLKLGEPRSLLLLERQPLEILHELERQQLPDGDGLEMLGRPPDVVCERDDVVDVGLLCAEQEPSPDGVGQVLVVAHEAVVVEDERDGELLVKVVEGGLAVRHGHAAEFLGPEKQRRVALKKSCFLSFLKFQARH